MKPHNTQMPKFALEVSYWTAEQLLFVKPHSAQMLKFALKVKLLNSRTICETSIIKHELHNAQMPKLTLKVSYWTAEQLLFVKPQS